MATRREFFGGFLTSGATLAGLPVFAQATSAWRIPSDEVIHKLLADRVERQKRGIGLVVGVIEPAGRRVVRYGRFAPNDPRSVGSDTIFQLGSVTKVFTTLLLSEMVLRGEVRLDDPAALYLPPGVRMPERGRPITLAHLATHTSGLPSMPTNLALKAKPNPIEAYMPSQLYAFLSTYQLPREPGAAAEYSNLAVSLLGRLLARRAGTDYESLVTARVLVPLGLASTSITLNADQRRRAVPGHDQYGRPVETWEMRTLAASGSLRSTADDMLEFLAARLGYRDTPLKAAMAFQTSQPRPTSDFNQSLGLGIRTDGKGGKQFGHNGGKAGYRSFIAFDPTARTGVIVLANMRSDDNLDPLGLHILTGRALPDAPPFPPAPPRRATVRPPTRLLKRYEGRYQFLPDVVLAVACQGERLLMDRVGTGVSEFFAVGEHEFVSREKDARIVFRMEDAGPATALLYSEDGRDRAPAPRIP